MSKNHEDSLREVIELALKNQRQFDELPEALTAEQVAALLGVDRNAVYDYANTGALPHRRLGKRMLFGKRAILDWLNVRNENVE